MVIWLVIHIIFLMWFTGQFLFFLVHNMLLSLCTYFYLNGKKIVSTHAYWQYISAGYLARFRTLVTTVEVFELSHKKIIFSMAVAIENIYILVC